MEVNLITEGFKFLALGMTTVFLFLLLMIYILKLQAFLVKRYFSDSSASTSKLPSIDPILAEKEVEEAQVIAAITAAITDFRKN